MWLFMLNRINNLNSFITNVITDVFISQEHHSELLIAVFVQVLDALFMNSTSLISLHNGAMRS